MESGYLDVESPKELCCCQWSKDRRVEDAGSDGMELAAAVVSVVVGIRLSV